MAKHFELQDDGRVVTLDLLNDAAVIQAAIGSALYARVTAGRMTEEEASELVGDIQKFTTALRENKTIPGVEIV